MSVNWMLHHLYNSVNWTLYYLHMSVKWTLSLVYFSKWDVPPPCGTYRDCADKSDGFYADMETKCSSFYICSNGVFMGHSLCPSGKYRLPYSDLMINVSRWTSFCEPSLNCWSNGQSYKDNCRQYASIVFVVL